jgi:hypothetical protein
LVAPEEEAEAEAVDLSKTVLRCNARFIESGEPPAAGREAAATGFAVRLPNVAAPCLIYVPPHTHTHARTQHAS